MGVYNPQMKMPIGCHRCDCYDICRASGKSIGRYNGERCPDCPLVEVKTPHGRLIDEDVCKQRVYDGSRTPYKTCPTVIEAEAE